MNEIEMIERFIEQMKQSLRENIFKKVTIKQTDHTVSEGILIYSDIFNYDYIIIETYFFKEPKKTRLIYFNTNEIISVTIHPSSPLISFEEAITSDCRQLREQAIKLHPDRPQ